MIKISIVWGSLAEYTYYEERARTVSVTYLDEHTSLVKLFEESNKVNKESRKK